MHRRRSEPAEAEYTPGVVGVNEALDRVSLQKLTAFLGRDAERPTQLVGVDRPALRKLPVQRDRDRLFLWRETPQVRLQHSPVFVERRNPWFSHYRLLYIVQRGSRYPAQQDSKATSLLNACA